MANLTFKSNGTTTVCLSAVGKPFTNSFLANGSAYTMGSGITLYDQDTVTFEGTNQYLSRNSENYYKFIISGNGTVEVSGDLASLTNNVQDVKDYQYIYLFKGCDKITSIEHLNFPTGIADFAYSNTFAGCTGLTGAGTTLPAPFASRWSYNGMFAYCTNLTVAPKIAATKSTSFSFYNMFVGCTSLTDGPKLFSNPRGKMNSNCMFKDCSNLSSVKVAYTSWPAGADQNESKNWLQGVAANGTLYKLAELTDAVVKPNDWNVATWQLSTITLTAQIPTFTFDAKSQTDIVSSLLDYVDYNGEFWVNCKVEGTLPAGITANNGVLTGVPSQFKNNTSKNFNVIYSAPDVISTLQTTMPLEINLDYQNMPFSIQPLNGGSGVVKMAMQEGSVNTFTYYYKKNTDTDWKFYTSDNTFPEIELQAGEYVSFSGTGQRFNTGWSGQCHTFNANVEARAFGNLSSLISETPSLTSDMFDHMFANRSGITNRKVVNLRDLWLPDSGDYCWYDGFCWNNPPISAGPTLRYPGKNQTYKYFFGGTSNLKVFEIAQNAQYAFDSNTFSSVGSNTVCILPSGFDSWGSYLTSSRFRYLYRDSKGIFTGSGDNKTYYDEDYLFETGNLRALT